MPDHPGSATKLRPPGSRESGSPRRHGPSGRLPPSARESGNQPSLPPPAISRTRSEPATQRTPRSLQPAPRSTHCGAVGSQRRPQNKRRPEATRAPHRIRGCSPPVVFRSGRNPPWTPGAEPCRRRPYRSGGPQCGPKAESSNSTAPTAAPPKPIQPSSMGHSLRLGATNRPATSAAAPTRA